MLMWKILNTYSEYMGWNINIVFITIFFKEGGGGEGGG